LRRYHGSFAVVETLTFFLDGKGRKLTFAAISSNGSFGEDFLMLAGM